MKNLHYTCMNVFNKYSTEIFNIASQRIHWQEKSWQNGFLFLKIASLISIYVKSDWSILLFESWVERDSRKNWWNWLQTKKHSSAWPIQNLLFPMSTRVELKLNNSTKINEKNRHLKQELTKNFHDSHHEVFSRFLKRDQRRLELGIWLIAPFVLPGNIQVIIFWVSRSVVLIDLLANNRKWQTVCLSECSSGIWWIVSCIHNLFRDSISLSASIHSIKTVQLTQKSKKKLSFENFETFKNVRLVLETSLKYYELWKLWEFFWKFYKGFRLYESSEIAERCQPYHKLYRNKTNNLYFRNFSKVFARTFAKGLF